MRFECFRCKNPVDSIEKCATCGEVEFREYYDDRELKKKRWEELTLKEREIICRPISVCKKWFEEAKKRTDAQNKANWETGEFIYKRVNND